MRRGLLGTIALLCLVTTMTGSASASFPGRNGSIAFTGPGTGFTGACSNTSCIKVVPPGGGVERTMYGTSGAGDATYSPDGKLLVFDRSTRAGCCQIYTVHIDGTHLRQITTNLDNEDPAWSPNGKQIVFSRRARSGIAQLYIANADGTNLHALTKGAIGGSQPDWSTSGIVFEGHGATGNDTFVIAADGTQEHDLTNGAPVATSAPSWSPDGQWIAFVSGHAVWRMRSDGTSATKLTTTASFKDRPAFSPDGTLIVYQDYRTDVSQLWVMHANGTYPRQITHDGSADAAPTWQPR